MMRDDIVVVESTHYERLERLFPSVRTSIEVNIHHRVLVLHAYSDNYDYDDDNDEYHNDDDHDRDNCVDDDGDDKNITYLPTLMYMHFLDDYVVHLQPGRRSPRGIISCD